MMTRTLSSLRLTAVAFAAVAAWGATAAYAQAADPADPTAADATDPMAADPAADPAAPADPAMDPAAGPAPAGDPAAAAAPGGDPMAADAAAAPADDPTAGLFGDDSLYGITEGAVRPGASQEWANIRKIRVVQKRMMIKEGRHGFALFGGFAPNDDFFAYLTTGLRYNYYFSEDLALEVSGGYAFDFGTPLQEQLERSRQDGGPGLFVRLPQVLVATSSVSVIWNLLHGKLGFFDTALAEFDVGLTFGIGAIVTEVTPQNESLAKEMRVDPNGNIGLTFNFYLTKQWAFRMDMRQFFYAAVNDPRIAQVGGVARPLMMTLGVQWFTEERK